jgi:16S rRNA (cytosine967-C5)-methyltransferase
MEEVDVQPLFTGARPTAVKILNHVERSDAYLDKLLDVELKSSDLSNVDKSLLAEIVHGVIRWQGRLDWVLNKYTYGNFSKSEINVKNTLRCALYQIMFLERIPHYAIVNEAVEFAKRLRGDKMANMVNAVLRTVLRNLDNIHYPSLTDDPLQYLSIFYAHPVWMVKRWLKRFTPSDVEKLLAANNEVPPITLRINKLKIQPAEFLTLLDSQGIQYQGSAYIDYFVRVKSLSRIGQLDAFQQGHFTVQDESAALPVLLLAPKPGDRVIDLCAAPGGKTTLIGELMHNEGEIIAVDKYEYKLNLVKTSCERLGIKNVSLALSDATEFETTPAVKVLVDAPCSGLGVLRKKPDIKWKRLPEEIGQLADLQERLLGRAAALVAPGGTLVYSTCTTEPEENENVVRRFLAAHPEFAIDAASHYVSHSVVSDDGFVITFPHTHQIDGSFAARLVRSAT